MDQKVVCRVRHTIDRNRTLNEHFSSIDIPLAGVFSDPDLEREKSVQFQILMKGMGGFGNRITNIMQEMIRGFREREY